MTLAPYFDHGSRRERLRGLLGQQGLEWLVVSRPVHVGYLTGFTGDSTVFIMGLRRDLLVSDGRYTEQLARECPGLETHIRTPSQKLVDIVPQVLGQLGASAVGVEAAGITLATPGKGCRRVGRAAPGGAPGAGRLSGLDTWQKCQPISPANREAGGQQPGMGAP